jgi:hypothetical protein
VWRSKSNCFFAVVALLGFSTTAAGQLSVIEAAEDYFAKGRYDLSLQKYGEITKNPFASPADLAVAQCRIGVIHSIQNDLSKARRVLEDSLRGQALPNKHAAICHYALLQVYVLGKNDLEARELVRRMGEIQLAVVYQARAYALAAEVGARLGDARFEVVQLQKLLAVMERGKLVEVELKTLANKKITIQEVRTRLGLEKSAAQKNLKNVESLPAETSKKSTENPVAVSAQEPVKNPTPVAPSVSMAQPEIRAPSFTQPSIVSTSSHSLARLFSFLGDGSVGEARVLAEQMGERSLQEALTSAGLGVTAGQVMSRLSRTAADDPRVVRVGVVLPVSGFFTRFNSRILRSLSSFQASSAAKGVEYSFVVKGVATDTGAADAAATALIFDDHVHAIVGPVSNSQTMGVLGIAQIFRVPVFALGPVVGAPEFSFDVLTRMGILARSQAKALVKHAQSDLKVQNAAIFAPNDSYGYEMSQAFLTEAKESLLPIQNLRYYSAAADVFKTDVAELIGPQDNESSERKKAYEELLKAAREKALQDKKKFDSKRVLLPPNLPYDALFVPEALGKSRVIASTFAYFGTENVRMLGDRQWIEGSGRSSIADPFMNGARVPAPTGGEFLSFLQKDLNEAGAHLDLERQAFDALILLRTAQFRARGNAGGLLVKALRAPDTSVRATMVYGPVDATGEPSARFDVMGYHNGKISSILSPWPLSPGPKTESSVIPLSN